MDDRQLWWLAFMTIYGWSFHPGSSRNGAPLSIDEAADIATNMVAKFRERFPL